MAPARCRSDCRLRENCAALYLLMTTRLMSPRRHSKVLSTVDTTRLRWYSLSCSQAGFANTEEGKQEAVSPSTTAPEKAVSTPRRNTTTPRRNRFLQPGLSMQQSSAQPSSACPIPRSSPE
ncbi:hypothetical protein EYF80_024217 [Liparis tanakae]|uniref:Uncharacterized protein n=1 Tax=Liparis tanakae TaxID=230148 RepID=A0A4Z2HI05_9TELE|nr:hypothetical protein EYF80_024217 [Liparis tanakae]